MSNTQAYDRWINLLRSSNLIAQEVLQAHLTFDSRLSLLNKLAHLDWLKSWLDLFRPLDSRIVTELKRRYDVRFTYNSNAIEGNTLSQRETALVLEQGITIGGKSLREHLEVVGHGQAIDYVESFTAADAPVDATVGEWELRQIHSLIMRTIDPETAGCYRALDVRAAGTDYVYPPHYQIQELMTGFVGWLNSELARSLHPVVYAAQAHLRLVTIHPFQDGNGRTARLLMNLLLIQSSYPIAVIPYEGRSVYLDAIVAAQAGQGDEGLIDLVARAAQNSLIELLGVVATAASSHDRGQVFFAQLIELPLRSREARNVSEEA